MFARAAFRSFRWFGVVPVALGLAPACRDAPKKADKPKAVKIANAAALAAPSVRGMTLKEPTAPALEDAALRASAVPSTPAPSNVEPELEPKTLSEQRAALLALLQRESKLGADELARVSRIFEASKVLGQGNPSVTEHPMTRAECRARRSAQAAELPAGDPRCGAPNMVPLYDPGAGEGPDQAKVCIDQYEFPNVACEYPVVHVRADEAAALCNAIGKRICDAHEWEGACAGALLPPEKEYAFGQPRERMRQLHNAQRAITWSYGAAKDHSKCATNSQKSAGCVASEYSKCGSNTYPAGAFPECRSPLGAFDIHGNAAEHMNLPRVPAELASRAGLGVTEMKGSWFIFSKYEAHIDDCRWRAPSWHESRVDAPNSHSNYHLGFRCCRDLRQ